MIGRPISQVARSEQAICNTARMATSLYMDTMQRYMLDIDIIDFETSQEIFQYNGLKVASFSGQYQC